MVHEVVSTVVFCLGLGVFWWRNTRKSFAINLDCKLPQDFNIFEQLAIIIPARNEATQLPIILKSLSEFMKSGGMVLVVNDQSTDDTFQIALNEGAHGINAPAKPANWAGKNWACHQGAQYLQTIDHSSRYWLFTDADTEHDVQKVKSALAWMIAQKVQLMTAIPYHKCESLWEKGMGPFQSLVLAITDAFQSSPTVSRYFSIGQFLLFERQYYQDFGGHLSVQNELAEDLALGKKCFESHKNFRVCPLAKVYSVRMYDQLSEFLKGWARNFRLGMKQSHFMTWIEVTLIIGASLGVQNIFQFAIFAISFAWAQRRVGQFSFWGALFYPWGIFIFILVSCLSMMQKILNKPIRWKSREYPT